MFTSSTHSSGVLCGGVLQCVVWWRFRQAKDGRGRKQRFEEAEEAVVGCKLFFFFFFFLIRSILIRDLSDKYKRVTWQVSIGWSKTSVLHHNLT